MTAPSSKKDWERDLLKALKSLGATLGFDRAVLGRRSFYRKLPVGEAAFHVSFVRRNEDFATGDVAVRFDAIESLVDPEGDDDVFTLGAELGNIVRAGPREWRLHTEDPSLVAGRIVESLKEIGIPYIERFSMLVEVQAILSSASPADWMHSPFALQRSMRAVAATHLLGRHAELPDLVARFEGIIRSTTASFAADVAVEKLRALVERLRGPRP